jgi:uncharacterized lipoprotein YddW (UPF0748 family)
MIVQMKRCLWVPLLLALFWADPYAGAAPVVLLRSTLSAPNDSERNYAQTMTRHLDRWLTDINIPHDTVDEDKAYSSLQKARVAILGYNPNLPSQELAELKGLVKRGGKLIVFYSADPALANLLGLKMGKYMATEAGGQWSAIRFNEQAPPHLPPVVYQESRNIRPVYPAGSSAKIIAYWETAAGKTLSDPAWLQSDKGLWMTHVLLDDGDTENKKQMLLGLIATCDSSMWAPAASRYLETGSTLGKFRSFSEVLQWIPAQATGTAGERRAKATLTEAGVLYDEIKGLYNDRRYADMVERSRGLRMLLLESYGMIQAPRAGEFRGVWNRFGTGLYPGDWNRTCKVLAANGFTDVIPFMLSPAAANYSSRILPASETLEILGDQLQSCIDAAHRNGLKVHAWKICWSMESASPDVLKKFKKQGRLQLSDKGETVNWLCPSQPENLILEKDAIRELLKNYDVDGVHLDYIRYRDGHSCFCPVCRDAYVRDTGRSASPWPPAAQDWEHRKEYYRWRSGQITRFVRDVRALAREIRPDVKISAAVYGKYSTCVEGVGQDWPDWIQKGYVDFVCPMNYTGDIGQFTDYVRSQLSLPGAAGKIYPGLGVTALESRLDPIQVVDQIVALRKEGAPGFTLFELNRVLEKEVLPILNLGITRRP